MYCLKDLQFILDKLNADISEFVQRNGYGSQYYDDWDELNNIDNKNQLRMVEYCVLMYGKNKAYDILYKGLTDNNYSGENPFEYPPFFIYSFDNIDDFIDENAYLIQEILNAKSLNRAQIKDIVKKGDIKKGHIVYSDITHTAYLPYQ